MTVPRVNDDQLARARTALLRSVAEMEEQTREYAHRVLAREEVDRHEALQLRRFPQADRQGVLLDDTDLRNFERLVVIGDAGSGKSYILKKAYLEAAQSFLHFPEAPFPCYLDLKRHLSPQPSVEQALEKAVSRWSRLPEPFADQTPRLLLFLDELDRRLLDESNPFDFINGLFAFIEEHGNRISSVILTCRRVFWSPEWLEVTQVPWEVYHADTLAIEDYAAIIHESELRQQFFERARELGILDLLQLPFFGFDLARKFISGENLPDSRRAWFRSRITDSLRGTEKDRQHHHAPPLELLTLMAQQLACLETFTERSEWTEQEVVDCLWASATFRDQIPSINHQQVKSLFQRPLFTKVGGRFSFSHQLFREFLTAQALARSPLRKQRQLLETPISSLQHRISTPHRGVAVFLAETSSPFRNHLFSHDPIVAFLMEGADLLPQEDEELTKGVIDDAIEEKRAPWFEVPPRGERLNDVLPKHKPRNVSEFLSTYIGRSDEFSLLWATACAKAWGGAITLNPRLVELAHDATLHLEIRVNAIESILATREVQSIHALYDLMDSPETHDQVRGHVLGAYRITDSPRPVEYIEKLRFDRNQKNLLSILHLEPAWYAESLDSEGLRLAFHELSLRFHDLGGLRVYLCQGLLERAIKIDYDDITPSFLLQLWYVRDGQIYYEQALKNLLSKSAALFGRVWNHVLSEIGQGNQYAYGVSMAQLLADAATDQIFDLLPGNPEQLTYQQDVFIRQVLGHHFEKEITIARYREFQQRAPYFTNQWPIPRSLTKSQGRDPLESRRKIGEILSRGDINASRKVVEIIGTVRGIVFSRDPYARVQLRMVADFLQELSAPLRQRVLDIFAEQVSSLKCSGFRPNRVPDPELAIPFWILIIFREELREELPVNALEQFIRCFAYLDYPPDGPGSEVYDQLLDVLRERDPGRWTRTVLWLLESSSSNLHASLMYLTSRQSELYVIQCREQLSHCSFREWNFDSLVQYWLALHPSDLMGVLRRCCLCLADENLRASLLYILISLNDNWAWNELREQVEAESSAYLAENRFIYRLLENPPDQSHLPILVDWYKWARRKPVEIPGPTHPQRILEEVIVRIGGEEAIAQLRRLQKENAFPGAEWLSYLILRIEDQMLSDTGATMEPNQLLDFVNRESFGVVLNERDLFEWVCQGIEDVKESLEGPAEQVVGYWNRRINSGSKDKWRPKHETECQNVLWPAVRSRLSNLGIIGVEERFVRANRADFWVERPQKAGQPLQVAVELKVARKSYTSASLIEVIETQLWRQYLEPTGTKHGIYIVLWFKDIDRYPYPTEWDTLQDFKEDLYRYANEVANRYQINLSCYVIDMTALPRLH